MTDYKADVIIVGAGPSGVAAAIEMRRRGAGKVLILDRETGVGGATRHCSHSPFGMLEFKRPYFGAAFGRKLETEARKAGVEIRLGHSVVALNDDASLVVATPKGMETFNARRIMLATGAREMPRSARLIGGDRPIGVVTTGTLQSYVAFHGLMPFRRPLIVGSEFVSVSALLTCLSHGARPVGMIEPMPHVLARTPLDWFPKLTGVGIRTGTELIDIRGGKRVESAVIKHQGKLTEVGCDGVLLTGRFTPEAALLVQSSLDLAKGSAGPAIDQDGRMQNPLYFAAGNILRAIETGGWAFREGRTIGAAIAEDLTTGLCGDDPIPVSFDEPVKLVVPSHLRRNRVRSGAMQKFQLRFLRRATGTLKLSVDGKTLFEKAGEWLPERRVLVPVPGAAALADSVHFGFEERP
ncbi:FAD-dependent oxidoreductase [uncultured Cohaesibacter sp.]|uniref:NAD(P)/FAD-dependent oxidoreductase n=1 Tax=uncultured Cohaesibacter sp. TaxID=1002546 RepID=UPI0029C7CE9B|nr:FAD-dependent oxidoreductase [uncultured Cohaesibacter sp.]